MNEENNIPKQPKKVRERNPPAEHILLEEIENAPKPASGFLVWKKKEESPLYDTSSFLDSV